MNNLLVMLVAFGSIAIIVGVVAYLLFLRSLRGRVKRAWLSVYECFLARADRVPLLVELVRGGAPEYQSLLNELIVARSATAGMARPSEEKRDAEKVLSDVLIRVIHEVEHRDELKKNMMFDALLREFSGWETELELTIIGYRRALAVYRSLAFGRVPEGYGEFSLDGE